MHYKICETELALQDLDEIFGYMVDVLKNRTAAKNFLCAVADVYDKLEDMPNMFPKCVSVSSEVGDLRKAVINNFIMVYRINEQKSLIEIYRFFYGARDYSKLL